MEQSVFIEIASSMHVSAAYLLYIINYTLFTLIYEFHNKHIGTNLNGITIKY